MELWGWISGLVRVRLTAADPESVLEEAVRRGLNLQNLERSGPVELTFSVSQKEWKTLDVIVRKHSGTLQILSRQGLRYQVLAWKKRPVLLFVLLMLAAASVYLPGRILFVRVSGNETVPARMILETVQKYGLSFGASRRAVRSERIKNELLGAIDTLEWVGVNTSGSVATVQVRERKEEPERTESAPCDLVAGTDGIVEEVNLIRGEVKCTPGQAVRKGDVLVTGFLDLGICTKLVEAEGEIYARTRHEISAVLPINQQLRLEERTQMIKYSLLVGKKRINLYSDSGILMPTCGKMTTINQLRLPGGFTLPVALVRETYTVYDTAVSSRNQEQAEAQLSDILKRNLLQDMVAGTILGVKSRWEPSEQLWALTASYECREMIARQDEGVYLQDYG